MRFESNCAKTKCICKEAKDFKVSYITSCVSPKGNTRRYGMFFKCVFKAKNPRTKKYENLSAEHSGFLGYKELKKFGYGDEIRRTLEKNPSFEADNVYVHRKNEKSKWVNYGHDDRFAIMRSLVNKTSVEEEMEKQRKEEEEGEPYYSDSSSDSSPNNREEKPPSSPSPSSERKEEEENHYSPPDDEEMEGSPFNVDNYHNEDFDADNYHNEPFDADNYRAPSPNRDLEEAIDFSKKPAEEVEEPFHEEQNDDYVDIVNSGSDSEKQDISKGKEEEEPSEEISLTESTSEFIPITQPIIAEDEYLSKNETEIGAPTQPTETNPEVPMDTNEEIPVEMGETEGSVYSNETSVSTEVPQTISEDIVDSRKEEEVEEREVTLEKSARKRGNKEISGKKDVEEGTPAKRRSTRTPKKKTTKKGEEKHATSLSSRRRKNKD